MYTVTLRLTGAGAQALARAKHHRLSVTLIATIVGIQSPIERTVALQQAPRRQRHR